MEFHTLKLPLLDAKLLIKVGILNFGLILLVLLLRTLRWVVFGDALTHHEIQVIRDKFHYTLFEFICGLAIYTSIQSLELKDLSYYALMFTSLLILKSFHHLVELRVSYHHNGNSLIHGISVLVLADCLIFWKVKQDFLQDPFLVIFGYETLNLLPMIMQTLFQFQMRSYTMSSYAPILMDLTLNCLRMTLFIVYCVMYNSHFLFPVHMLPSSYKCFRLLLSDMRSLMRHKLNQIKIQKYNSLPAATDCTNNELCFCLEPVDPDHKDVRSLDCHHDFHFDCLKHWLARSETCPMCREPLVLS